MARTTKPRKSPVAESTSKEEDAGIDPNTGTTREEREAENAETQREHITDTAEGGVINEPASVGSGNTRKTDMATQLASEPPRGGAHSSNALQQPPIDRRQARVYPKDVLPNVEKKTNAVVVNRTKLQKPVDAQEADTDDDE